jgi:hypothetical protein
MAFTRPKLPYPKDALAPHMSGEYIDRGTHPHCRQGPLQQRRPSLKSHLLLALHGHCQINVY